MRHFESGDLPAAMRAVHPDLVTYRADPDAGTFHGREGDPPRTLVCVTSRRVAADKP
jgi:hypothetical protein